MRKAYESRLLIHEGSFELGPFAAHTLKIEFSRPTRSVEKFVRSGQNIYSNFPSRRFDRFASYEWRGERRAMVICFEFRRLIQLNLLTKIFHFFSMTICRKISKALEMWLRSEHVSRRLRGRLSTGSNVSTGANKVSSSRVQGGAVRKVPAVNNSSQRVNTSSRCGRLTRWRRRSPNLLKEVNKRWLKTKHEDIKSLYLLTDSSLIEDHEWSTVLNEIK